MSRAHELSNDVSFVIFGHKTWDLEGIDPPPAYPGFQVSGPAVIGLKVFFYDQVYELDMMINNFIILKT